MPRARVIVLVSLSIPYTCASSWTYDDSIIYLDLLSENLGIPIRHALNGGEKKFVKYWVDVYIEEHNICIELYEKYHSINKFKEKDKIREEFLVSQCNCCVIRINEKEFSIAVIDSYGFSLSPYFSKMRFSK